MANVEISDIARTLTPLVGTEYIEGQDATGSFKATTQAFADLARAGLVIGTNVQAYAANLTTFAGITPSANIQSFLASADYSAARTNLGLAIGANVQAYSANLTTFAGIAPSANVQTLLASANYAAMRTNLGLVIGTNVQAYDPALAGIALKAAKADPTFTGTVSISEAIKLPGDLQPPNIGADVNDYAPTGFSTCTLLRLIPSSAPRIITGLAGGVHGRVVLLFNASGFQTLTLAHESASSTAANRFSLGGANRTFAPGRMALLYYDNNDSRWHEVGGGDLLAVNNLSDVADAVTAGANLRPVESLVMAVADETTTITTGVAKLTFRMPYAFTVTAVRASLTTASSSGLPTVDINEAGTSILSTKLTIDANELTSTTAATPAVISDAALADDAEITIDIDVAGTGAKGLKVYLIGHRT